MPHDGWHPHDHPHHHAHDRPTRRLVLAAATFLPFGGASAQSADAQQRIAEQANRLLALLDDRQRRQVLIAFDSANRVDWHYIPRSRSGLSLGEMSDRASRRRARPVRHRAQRAAARSSFALRRCLVEILKRRDRLTAAELAGIAYGRRLIVRPGHHRRTVAQLVATRRASPPGRQRQGQNDRPLSATKSLRVGERERERETR